MIASARGKQWPFHKSIAEELSLSPERRRRASPLHDIGKLRVSNTILDKPGKLDEACLAALKQSLRRVGAPLAA